MVASILRAAAPGLGALALVFVAAGVALAGGPVPPVPEPATMTLLAAGAAMFGGSYLVSRRRRRNKDK